MKGESRAVQEDIVIKREMVKIQCRKIPLWKAPGSDGVQGFWLKKLTSLYERIAVQLDDILNSRMTLPEWMTFRRTVLCLKDPTKGNAVVNYRPISCGNYSLAS